MYNQRNTTPLNENTPNSSVFRRSVDRKTLIPPLLPLPSAQPVGFKNMTPTMITKSEYNSNTELVPNIRGSGYNTKYFYGSSGSMNGSFNSSNPKYQQQRLNNTGYGNSMKTRSVNNIHDNNLMMNTNRMPTFIKQEIVPAVASTSTTAINTGFAKFSNMNISMEMTTGGNNSSKSGANASFSTIQNNKDYEKNGTTTNLFGSSLEEKLFIFTGTIEKIMEWHKIFNTSFCYYEVIANVISLQEGAVKTQKIMLLRNRKGPILQIAYYLLTHIELENFHLGQNVRCLGYMVGPNILKAFSIREAYPEEMENLERMTLISDQAAAIKLKITLSNLSN